MNNISSEEILKTISSLCLEHGYTDKTPEKSHHLKDDLGLDSVGLLSMIDELEEEYDIVFGPDDMATQPSTVEDIQNLVQSKLQNSKT